ncbi:hypothetical protein LZ32DRAFT_423537 [Colletotrichum eremochloae]|nr:hypothetical protein LZ32DRAFT_423537 [Colletotrichum eremochloae]
MEPGIGPSSRCRQLSGFLASAIRLVFCPSTLCGRLLHFCSTLVDRFADGISTFILWRFIPSHGPAEGCWEEATVDVKSYKSFLPFKLNYHPAVQLTYRFADENHEPWTLTIPLSRISTNKLDGMEPGRCSVFTTHRTLPSARQNLTEPRIELAAHELVA